MTFGALLLAWLGLAAAQHAGPGLECACEFSDAQEASFSLECAQDSSGLWVPEVNDGNSWIKETIGTSCNSENGYQLIPKLGYYKLHKELKEWDQAAASCRSEGANLAVINSEEEAKALRKIFEGVPDISKDYYENIQAWIGASDSKEEGKFVTIYGTTLQEAGWEKWNSGQPANRTQDEDCVTFMRYGELNDNICHKKLAYFCEKAGAHRIPEDYVKLGSGYYKLHTNLASWQDAVQECAREGANLAVINSEEEAKHLMDLFQRYPDIDQRQWVNGQAWVGLNDLKTEGQFVTISGEPLKDVWAVWAPGDPNNHGDGEDCVSVRRDATLNDFGCGYTVPFFCELPPRSY